VRVGSHGVPVDYPEEGDTYLFVNKDGEYESFSLAPGVDAVQFDLDRKRAIMEKQGAWDDFNAAMRREKQPRRRLGFSSWTINIKVCYIEFTVFTPYLHISGYPYYKFSKNKCVSGANYGGDQKVDGMKACAKKCSKSPKCQAFEYWQSCSSGKKYCRLNKAKSTSGCKWSHCGDGRGCGQPKSPGALEAGCTYSYGIVDITGGFDFKMGSWPTGWIKVEASMSGGTVKKIINTLPWGLSDIVEEILGGINVSGKLSVTAKNWYGGKNTWMKGDGGTSLRVRGTISLNMSLDLYIVSAGGKLGAKVTLYYINKCTKKGKKGYLAIDLDFFVKGELCFWAVSWWCWTKKYTFNIYPWSSGGQKNTGANDGSYEILAKPCKKCLPCDDGVNFQGNCVHKGKDTGKFVLFACG